VASEIKLSGGEITMLKALGLSGSPLYGKLFIDRMGEMASAEFLDTLSGLLSSGYVLSSKVNVVKIEEAERASFRVDPAYAKELRDAMRPGGKRGAERERRRRRA
jgi:hypothetical protein